RRSTRPRTRTAACAARRGDRRCSGDPRGRRAAEPSASGFCLSPASGTALGADPGALTGGRCSGLRTCRRDWLGRLRRCYRRLVSLVVLVLAADPVLELFRALTEA